MSRSIAVGAGLPTASFLANVYLMEVDRYFQDAGVLYARYSDDIILFAQDRETLEEHHVGWIFELKRGTLRVIPEKISCDAWRFFSGDVDAVNEYQGEYMNTYSWANMREAYLDRISENRK
jgi:hypothetical protein